MNEKHLKIMRALDRVDDLAEQLAICDNMVRTKAQEEDVYAL